MPHWCEVVKWATYLYNVVPRSWNHILSYKLCFGVEPNRYKLLPLTVLFALVHHQMSVRSSLTYAQCQMPRLATVPKTENIAFESRSCDLLVSMSKRSSVDPIIASSGMKTGV